MLKIQTTAICVCHLEANYKNVNICRHRNSCKIYWKDIMSIYTCLSKWIWISSKCLALTRMWINNKIKMTNNLVHKLHIYYFIIILNKTKFLNAVKKKHMQSFYTVISKKVLIGIFCFLKADQMFTMCQSLW